MAVQKLTMLERQGSGGLQPAALPPPDGDAPGLSLAEVVGTLRRRLRLILVVIVAGTLLAAALGQAFTPKYTATAAVVIDATDSSFFEVLADRMPEGVSPDRINTEIELITSRSHLHRVMGELDLYDAPWFQPPVAEDASGVEIHLPEPLRTLAGVLPETWLIKIGVAEEALTPVEEAAPEIRQAAALERFRKRLEVSQQNAAQVIAINVTLPDPGAAARIANGIAESYVTSQVEYKRELASQAAGWIEDRLGELQASVQDAERQVQEYQTEKGLALNAEGGTLNDQRLVDLDQQRRELRAQLIEREAKLNQIRALQRAPGGNGALAGQLDSPLLATLQADMVAREREIAELGQTFGPNHPQMLNLRADRAALQARFDIEVERAVGALEDEIAVISSRAGIIDQDLNRLQGENARERQDMVRLNEYQRQAVANQELYEIFLRQFKENQQRIEMMVADARLISRAVPPEEASTPGPPVFALVGFTVSVMFGSLLAFLTERLDDRIRNTDAIERQLGLGTLGILPKLKKRGARRWPGRYIAERPFSSFAEAARSIITTLRMHNYGAASPVVMVTSALPREGKTTLSISLAAAAARSGLKTLLIDLDLRCPTLDDRLAGRHDLPGLVDHLHDELPRSELIHHDADSGIDFVAVGDPPHNPLEILQSPRLRHLIETWRREYDHVIIDSAPVLAVTDTRVATRLVDRVIIAARWQKTDIGALSHALRSLLDVDAEIAGCVLTGVDMNKYKLYARGDAGSYYKRYRRYYLE